MNTECNDLPGRLRSICDGTARKADGSEFTEYERQTIIARRRKLPAPPAQQRAVRCCDSGLLDAIESALGYKVTCGACLNYIATVNSATHNHADVVNKLEAELSISKEIREHHRDLAEWLSTIVEPFIPRKHGETLRRLPSYFKKQETMQAHRDMMQARLAEVFGEPVPECEGRAVLIPAGGECTTYGTTPVSYFRLAYVAAYVLRRTGCLLPIEFWFLPGEMESINDCVPLATSVGAVCRVLDTQSMRHVGGWQTKINAILQTSYRHVLHLDADNIVRNDPTYLFDSPEFEGTGAIFWPDDFSKISMVTNEMLRAVGLPEDGPHRGFETGQILLDKKRCWPALLMTKHFADHADYWGGIGGKKRNKSVVWYGDKDDFWMAWRLTGCGSVHMQRPVFPFNPGGFFEHKDPRGRVLFQHVTQAKLSLSQGKGIAEMPNTGCCTEAIEGMTPIPWLEPGDIVGAAELISPERHFRLWDDDQTRGVWIDVVRRNEYRLPDKFDAADVVIDIGGQTGSFAFAAGKRGARVVSFEPYEPSFRRLQHNTRGLNVAAHNMAVLRSDREAGRVILHDHSGEYKCGSFTLEHRGTTQATWQVDGITLDDVLRKCDSVRLLKMDCEGSEWPLLYTSAELHRVQAVCGEYHEIPPADGDWKHEWNASGLNQFLAACGFKNIRVCEHLWPWGHFWATR